MPIVRDKSHPLELSRAEGMSLVFERLLNVSASIEECETVKDYWNSDKRVETLWHELKQMRGDVKRAIEIVESLLDDTEGTD